eukprot:gb/GECH01014523.1/.p1 GENE.gb/GECH01014523.1/~~gb/GECH01014523.1/.p1  ORF type:complete len:369 (+),score=84.88 gb/GECH01014523.1/:1-1107(+)
MSQEAKPSVLVLGACGFVGRHFVKYLVDEQLVSYIRAVDKQLPATSYMSEEFMAAFNNEIVEVKQCNLSNAGRLPPIFERDPCFDYVVNLAAETRFGQEKEAYEQMVYNLSVVCGKEASKHPIKKYIEVSTAQVYEPSSKPSDENAKLKPWTQLAKFKLSAEEELKKIDDLPLVIVRPAIIYGPADQNGLAPRLIVGATYKYTKEKMKFLWSGDLRINCVHVVDVVRALWHLLETESSDSSIPVYNLVDKSDLTQKKMNALLSKLFGISTGFHGSILSNLASVRLSEAVDHANDKHLEPWAQMCKEQNIEFTPLSPYIDVELMANRSLCVDGSAIEKTGFEYKIPEISAEKLQEEMDYYVNLGVFPRV